MFHIAKWENKNDLLDQKGMEGKKKKAWKDENNSLFWKLAITGKELNI